MEDIETHEPQTRRLSIDLTADSLSLNFLVYFDRMSSYFSMKTNKRKVRKCLKYTKEFSRRFDMGNGKYLSIFLGVFARKLHILLRLSIWALYPCTCKGYRSDSCCF